MWGRSGNARETYGENGEKSPLNIPFWSGGVRIFYARQKSVRKRNEGGRSTRDAASESETSRGIQKGASLASAKESEMGTWPVQQDA